MLWVNALALQRAGITAATPDPAHEAILRDSAGEPAGILEEQEATQLVSRVIDRRDPVLTRLLVQCILGELQRSGITMIHDIEGRASLQLFQALRDKGQLGVRVQMILPRNMLPELRALGLQAGFGDEMLRLGGIKIFAVRTLGSQTTAMLESYEGNPGNRGILTIPEAEMKETVSAGAEMRLSIAIHAIGDRAARVALNAIELAHHSLPVGMDPSFAGAKRAVKGP